MIDGFLGVLRQRLQALCLFFQAVGVRGQRKGARFGIVGPARQGLAVLEVRDGLPQQFKLAGQIGRPGFFAGQLNAQFGDALIQQLYFGRFLGAQYFRFVPCGLQLFV